MTRPNDAPWSRPDGYAEAYAERRFQSGSGPKTHEREVAILERLLAQWRAGVETGDRPGARGTWLDVPSGAGRFSDRLPGEVVAVDRDLRMLDEAGHRTSARSTVCATALQLPFADQVFEGALCFRLLHHLAKPEERLQVLSELRRVVRGPLLFSYFDKRALQHWRRVVRRRLGKKRSSRNAISRSVLVAEFGAAGYRIDRLVGLSPWISEQWIGLARPLRPDPERG